jgi:adenylate kinase family enzyme
MHKKVLFLFGPSGCGKGTQYSLLKEQLSGKVSYFSSGERLTQLEKSGGRLARAVTQAKGEGLLVPQEIIQHLWSTFLDRETEHASWIIFDGSPRFLSEARALQKKLSTSGLLHQIIVLSFSAEDLETLRERMLLRKRSDDTEEKIARRFAWFANETLPVLRFFHDQPSMYRVFEINAVQSPEEVQRDILFALRLHE